MEGNVHSVSQPSKLSESNRTITETNRSSMRVYQAWKGSNRFFCGGRLIFGPDVRSMALTVCLILVPIILFVVFVTPKLATEFSHRFASLIMGITVTFTTYVIFLLLFTSGRDPGIVPRSAHPPEPDDDAGSSTYSSDWMGSQHNSSSLPPTKDVLVNGIIVKVKYCHTCMLYRPPRCSHCSICNNCVDRFDHHCPWVGQCIGKRNYRFFFMFVSSTTMLCLFVFSFCWVNLKKTMNAYECHLWKAVMRSPVSGILIIYTFIAAWFVGGLTAFHMYLICTNQTTYENFRYRYDKKANPYNHGCARNIVEIFFSSIPKSKNNFRAIIKQNSTVFSSLSLGQVSTPAKTSVDLETGRKRQGVVEEELEDILSEIGSVRNLERCGTQPMHSSFGDRKVNWEPNYDMQTLSTEFGMDYGYPNREKVQEYH
ncbi:palmitoyltransferase ZDHHC9/14/18 protein [Dioscorea alata]|uniref:Palmitoyltransferase ZDHHC9/14/18 protein n=1 Tax=Dioscorea alata TaxID=55571 RepID=A0ACB7UTC3_DIOAL|nr:palmitoyltransferase ZDHHC9/14/18 protein [Dioscorea alata]